MNCKEAILEYMNKAGEAEADYYREFTARELANRVGKDAQGGGPEYNLNTIRRTLAELYAEGKVSRRLVGGHFLWRNSV